MMKRWIFIVASVILASALATAQQPSGEASVATPASKSHTSVGQRVRISRAVAQGLLIKTVPLKYPKDAHRDRIQGMVILKARIDTDGNVEDVTLISGEKALAPAAMEAVKQWKYKPYLLNGQPVDAEFEISINFSLSGS
jgi:periplasmic protein TonB